MANNLAVQANTNKVSATGPVTTHSDITSAGSGQIITTSERTKLSNIEDNAQVNTVNSVAGKTGDVVLDSSDVGLGNVPNIDTTNANNITSGTLSGSRLSYGTVVNTPAQGNDARFTDSREWTASTVSQSVAQAGTDTNRHAWTSQRVRDNVSFYTQPYTSTEKSKLAGLNSADYLPVGGTAVNSQLLDNIASSQFLRSDTNQTFYGTLSQANNNDTSALVCQNSSYPGFELHIGGWSISNSNDISRIRNSHSNLHIDSAANGGLYLNWFTNGDINASSTLRFYNKTRTVRLGDIGSDVDDNWLRINQHTNKNIYTPRMIRADGGFQVDSKQVVSVDGNTLYENNVALATKYIRKDTEDTINAHTRWADNKELRLGSQADGRIFHSGGNFHLHCYTGDIFYQNYRNGGVHRFQSRNAERVIQTLCEMYPNSNGIKLFYEGAERLRTTANGINVYGNGHVNCTYVAGEYMRLESPSSAYIDLSNSSAVRTARLSVSDGSTSNYDGQLKIESGSINLISKGPGDNSIVFFQSDAATKKFGLNTYSNNFFYIQQYAVAGQS
ncbi:MAG: hypothetical protein VXZ35_00335, partial [Pseudomonadota bacterium]|nr:hypothetical protein [Pseudomonadota bacterium]